MCDNFQNVGKQPLFKDRLNKFVTDGAILVAVSLSSLAEIPSGPFAFDTLRVRRCCSTSSTVRSISSVSIHQQGLDRQDQQSVKETLSS